MWRCSYCSSSLPTQVLQKHRMCPSCGTDLHTCKNCVQFQENDSPQCKEPNSPWIRDRNTQNSCPFFEFRRADDPPRGQDSSKIEAEKAKEAFRALFRDV